MVFGAEADGADDLGAGAGTLKMLVPVGRADGTVTRLWVDRKASLACLARSIREAAWYQAEMLESDGRPDDIVAIAS